MDLYFKDINATGNWNDPDHWFEDAAATIPYNAVPWVADDATKAYDLHRSTDSIANGETVVIDADIGNGFTITGTCSIGYNAGSALGSILQNYSTIYSGTFTGEGFYNSGSINGGSFVLDYFSNYGSIYGGSFVVNTLTNGSYIYAGKFDGTSYSNSSTIYGGIFNTSTGLSYDGYAMYGTVIDFTILSDFLFCSGDNSGYWSSSTWYEDYECTIPWTGDVPWTSSATFDKNIAKGVLADSTSIQIAIDTTIGQGFEITGTCYINYDGGTGLLNYDSIYSGNFIGNYVTNSGANGANIYGGNFSGDYFINDSYGNIYGGTFSGNFITNTNSSYIYGGTFTGDLTNTGYGSIFSGNFQGTISNDAGYIYGGLFTGISSFNASNGTIYGGLFGGDSFASNGYIYGGIFYGDNFSGGNYGGYFLESGSMDVSPAYGEAPVRITGQHPNTDTYMPSINIAGQDVLGAGLL